MPEPRVPRTASPHIGLLPMLGFGLLAIVADEIERLPYDLVPVVQQGAHAAVLHQRLHRAGVEGVLVLVAWAALRGAARLDRTLLARPARFLAWLLGAATLGWGAMMGAEALLGLLPSQAGTGLPWRETMRAWTTLLMWGVLWGWLFFHHLQQREHDQRLTLLLGQRAVLSRQLLQARLAHARSQIDPGLIARVLRRVREQADGVPTRPAAVGLVDRLAGYLRLLLQRVRHTQPMLAGDLELLRDYAMLAEAQHGLAVQVHIASTLEHRGTAPAGCTFPAARLLLDASLAEAARAARAPVALTLKPAHTGLHIEADWPATAPENALHALSQRLAALHPGLALYPTTTPHGRHLVAHVPLD